MTTELTRRVNHVLNVAQNVLSMRQEVFRRTLDPRRNVHDECGYPRPGRLTVQDCRELFRREGAAKRVVTVLPRGAFLTQPDVYEDEDSEVSTPFEEAYDRLSRDLRGDSSYQEKDGSPLVDFWKRLAIAARQGRYGVGLIGIDDGLPLDTPAELAPRRNVVKPRRKKAVPDPSLNAPLTTDGPKVDPEGKPLPGEEGKFDKAKAEKDAHEEAGNRMAELAAPKGKPKKPFPFKPTNNTTTVTEDDLIRAVVETDRQRGLPNKFHGTVDNYLIPPPGRGDPLADQRGDWGWKNGTHADSELDKEIRAEVSDDGLDAELGTKRRVTYLRVFTEDLAQITEFCNDESSARMGSPEFYNVTFNDPHDGSGGIGQATSTRKVHWTRVIHYVDDKDCNECFGHYTIEPCLHPILNIQKILGADGESFWKGCLGLLALTTHPELGGDVEVDVAGVKDELEKLQNSLQKFIVLMGMSATNIAPTVTDPTSHVAAQYQAISMATGIPMRKLTGAEEGQLASGQDDGDWNDLVEEYRNATLVPNMIVPTVDRFISMGCLPEPAGFSVDWPEAVTSSPGEKANVALTKVQAIAAYVSGQLKTELSPMNFWTKIMDLDEEEAASIVSSAMQLQEQEKVKAQVEQQEAIDAGLAPDPTDPEQVLAHGLAQGGKPNPFQKGPPKPGFPGGQGGSKPPAPNSGANSGVAGRGKPPFGK